MKSSSTVFLAAFLALSASWAGFVLVPQIQLGRADQAKTIPAGDKYPVARPGLAQQGAEVYRSLGCVYCHSQQVGQQGVKVEVVLLDAGTNGANVFSAISKVHPELGKPELLVGLPKTIAEVKDIAASDALLKAVAEAGGKSEVNIVPTGSDMKWNWGKRRTVAQDYVYDSVVQIGTRRAGPDLTNVGAPARKPDLNWHLRHLYAPQAEVKGSTMPGYQFLFEKRKIGKVASEDALKLTGEFAPPAGYEIVPTEKARALAAYLVSLHADAPLFESPVTPPPAPVVATNSVAAK
ncbi:MAG: cbb3-type cytochrome c oxidase subunit II [Verrucomicrobiota bacterium]